MLKEYELDLSGLPCPMPIVRLKKFLAEHASEKVVIFLKATDRGALKDIPAYCQMQKLHCSFESEEQGVLHFRIE